MADIRDRVMTLDYNGALWVSAADYEEVEAKLSKARSIIDDLRFHDLSGRADEFLGRTPPNRTKTKRET